ncbi:AsmA family protein [Paraglaciecola psychrophila]|uniref:AsmA domain-containing protein n=1 Tax=Paraglaciecola psychrophila 170 TaxID=1129794 RepID=K6Z583_9ALTE|nr:hypothetical protein [Paraglaciecola psychrophila]AGH47009.1 hypothetical protein C427_4910 [Paraglaciecola psychrophila 170]GAC40239.1 hypothetical protein GPSY_4636 [Paraglaciecola psychrophila 170]
MKKGLGIFTLVVLLIAGGAWYMLSGAGDFIRAQIEQQGSQYLATTVSVFKVDLALTEGRMTISDLDIKNPKGFSNEDAFSVDTITLDLGNVTGEPYVIQTMIIDAPEILYEVDASGKGNLIVIKNNLTSNLPKTENKNGSEPVSQEVANPLVIIESITVSNVRLKFNFEQLSTGDLKLDKKVYEVTLPTFNAGPIGQPNGMPTDQVGITVVNTMLDNVIAAAKTEARKRIEEGAKKKAEKEFAKQKDMLLEKANDKLKNLFN